MRVRSKVVVGTVLAAFFACNTYDSSLLEPRPGADVPVKGGIGWWSKDDGRGCFSAGAPRPEDRPASDGDEDVGPILLAADEMRLGSVNEDNKVDPNAWQDIGLDIDGVCTASETCEQADLPPSCKPTASQLPRDGRYCRDNTFGRLEHAAALIPELSARYGLSHDKLNCDLCVGHYNFLIRITGYNGKPNDDRVRLDLYPSPGLEKPLPWDCNDPTWRTRPCFTPTCRGRSRRTSTSSPSREVVPISRARRSAATTPTSVTVISSRCCPTTRSSGCRGTRASRCRTRSGSATGSSRDGSTSGPTACGASPTGSSPADRAARTSRGAFASSGSANRTTPRTTSSCPRSSHRTSTCSAMGGTTPKRLATR